MANIFDVPDIQGAVSDRLLPTVTIWNRLEGRPRTADFRRALRAEVRDALWMLTRQWQIGEFKGDDAGSPVSVKLRTETTQVTAYRPKEHAAEPFPNEVPLETHAERRPVPLSLNLRAVMGRQWLKQIRHIGDYRAAFIAKYPFPDPDPSRRDDASLCAHMEVWQTFAAAATRLMDGGALYMYLKAAPANRAYDGIAVAPGDQADLDTQAREFVGWFESLIDQPTADADAWDAPRLEYRFSISAPGLAGHEKVLVASDYHEGRLDWYSFDHDRSATSLTPPGGGPPHADPRAEETRGSVPVPVTFAGMPDTRWWAFEDGKTNFGDVKPETTELAKLLLIEFGLVYANDWFLIPYTLPVGTIANIRGLAVTNVFGERFWIEAAGRGADSTWQRWSLFANNSQGAGGDLADDSLLLLPTVPHVLESEPVEEIMWVRDELANMVWAIERTVQLAGGEMRRGGEAAAERRHYYEQLLNARFERGEPRAAAPEPKAPIRYDVMNTTPENWIPFIPVHVEGDNRRIQLQRAAMPRLLDGDPDPPEKIRPMTTLLREGLDRELPQTYFVHEEEVPRAGTLLTLSFQRTRWLNGRTLVWLGVQKQTGRGEGNSGLAFDRIIPTMRRTS